MKLKQLLIDVECEYEEEDGGREITSVVYSSREVQEGSLFICIRGFQSDGHRYIPQAVAEKYAPWRKPL